MSDVPFSVYLMVFALFWGTLFYLMFTGTHPGWLIAMCVGGLIGLQFIIMKTGR